jgi:3-deoxy-D-manno-octulosonate 8-phosphate phosphatase KdsC-like HAD superfamily phosphatase
VSTKHGGHGAVRELVDAILRAQNASCTSPQRE